MGLKILQACGVLLILTTPVLSIYIQNEYKNTSGQLSATEWTEPEGIWSSLLEEWAINNK